MTSGEPAGVGPELCLALTRHGLACELVCLADETLLAARARRLGLPATLRRYDPAAAPVPGGFSVLHQPLEVESEPGRPDPRNGAYVLGLLERAVAGTLAGEFAALVTAPVQKSLLNAAGIPFRGHTEYLGARTGASHPVMLLTDGTLRVALATTHLPLREVSAALTPASLRATLEVLGAGLRQWWGIAAPRIAVCGLNPHAGEGGYLGDEEQRVIAPVLAALEGPALRLSGPLPADTVFVPRVLAGYDAVLAMYHDQGLPVLKHAAFERAVNVTLGLPLLRTSPDHGTALDLAGTGRADPGSLTAAAELASRLALQRR
ncbi:MAG: 4-hydroxythreonine-4-phosphate dehydrogenase PdxA [Gammaproteobacteria bacterium]|nr:4-hydroxythreonine-4-phosphate dehydrogenase PdxA [Gammaproteobacteria bacterium]